MENTVKAKTIFDEYFDSTKLAKFTPALIVAASIFCLIFLLHRPSNFTNVSSEKKVNTVYRVDKYRVYYSSSTFRRKK